MGAGRARTSPTFRTASARASRPSAFPSERATFLSLFGILSKCTSASALRLPLSDQKSSFKRRIVWTVRRWAWLTLSAGKPAWFAVAAAPSVAGTHSRPTRRAMRAPAGVDMGERRGPARSKFGRVHIRAALLTRLTAPGVPRRSGRRILCPSQRTATLRPTLTARAVRRRSKQKSTAAYRRCTDSAPLLGVERAHVGLELPQKPSHRLESHDSRTTPASPRSHKPCTPALAQAASG